MDRNDMFKVVHVWEDLNVSEEITISSFAGEERATLSWTEALEACQLWCYSIIAAKIKGQSTEESPKVTKMQRNTGSFAHPH